MVNYLKKPLGISFSNKVQELSKIFSWGIVLMYCLGQCPFFINKNSL